MKIQQKIICAIALLGVSAAIYATPAWKIMPEHSQINFTATQNNAPVAGSFKHFSGEIVFDPAQLKSSHVHMVIDMNSVESSYQDMSDTLKTSDWFNTKLFPEAIFTADHFTKTGDKTYQAAGNLTIRDKTAPVILDFTLEKYTKDEANVKGAAELKRLLLDVGQGDFESTVQVKDAVKIDFLLAAIHKPGTK